MNKNDLTPADRELLEGVLATSVHSMTLHDRKVLRARQDYLTDAEKEDFADVLNSTEEDEVVDDNETPEAVSYKDLQAKAKELGLPYVGVSRDDLETTIA